MGQESQGELPSLCLMDQSGVPIKDANLRIQCGILIEVNNFCHKHYFCDFKECDAQGQLTQLAATGY